MKSSPNNVILIDCWQHLQHPLEVSAKKKIQDLFSRLEGKKNWQIYSWNTDLPLDEQIHNQLVNGDFKVALDFADPLQIFNTWHLDCAVRYFFCGFHANHCLFYNTIGIEKYLQIADKSKSQFWILNDATVALSDYQPCRPQDIPWAVPSETDHTTAVIMNYRNYVIRTNSMQSEDLAIS